MSEEERNEFLGKLGDELLSEGKRLMGEAKKESDLGHIEYAAVMAGSAVLLECLNNVCCRMRTNHKEP